MIVVVEFYKRISTLWNCTNTRYNCCKTKLYTIEFLNSVTSWRTDHHERFLHGKDMVHTFP
jgi:hypothetical protein